MSHARPDEDYFSPGFRNLLVAITPYGRPCAVFPQGCESARISSQEGAHAWFRKLVDEKLAGDPGRCAVEENMAVVARINYAGTTITYASIQVLVAEADLTTFYCDSSVPSRYLRLDHDLDCLGPLFKEPLPHIHCFPEDAPRFCCSSVEGNVVVDFFDFIYRNFHHDRWLAWARRAYTTAAPNDNTDDDMLAPIEAAFNAGKHAELLSRYSEGLRSIKSACRQLKDRVFSARLDREMTDALSYESL